VDERRQAPDADPFLFAIFLGLKQNPIITARTTGKTLILLFAHNNSFLASVNF
jgi:hypothetical protein